MLRFPLPTKSRSRSQAKKERRALKRLRDLGIIKRADLRKAPSAAQRRTIKKYGDLLSGRAKAIKPKNPRSYSKVFKVAGKSVIVPKRKGETIRVNKAGEIVRKRKKKSGAVTRGVFKHVPNIEKFKTGKTRSVYAVPFARGGVDVQWFRFKTWDDAVKFMQSASIKGYENWANYVVVETIGPRTPITPRPDSEGEDDRNAALDNALETKLAGKRRIREHGLRSFGSSTIAESEL